MFMYNKWSSQKPLIKNILFCSCNRIQSLETHTHTHRLKTFLKHRIICTVSCMMTHWSVRPAQELLRIRSRFSLCARFKTVLTRKLQPQTTIEAMLSLQATWNAINIFSLVVFTELRLIERRKGNYVN